MKEYISQTQKHQPTNDDDDEVPVKWTGCIDHNKGLPGEKR